MDDYQERLFLMKQLIEFAKIDGILHDKEMDFLTVLAEDFGIDKETYFSLYEAECIPLTVSFSERIVQFYRLTLLMLCDGHWHDKEVIKLHEIGIMMGLNPVGIDKLLDFIKQNGATHVTPEFLSDLFTTQLN
jgi:hypothetical protein